MVSGTSEASESRLSDFSRLHLVLSCLRLSDVSSRVTTVPTTILERKCFDVRSNLAKLPHGRRPDFSSYLRPPNCPNSVGCAADLWFLVLLPGLSPKSVSVGHGISRPGVWAPLLSSFKVPAAPKIEIMICCFTENGYIDFIFGKWLPTW